MRKFTIPFALAATATLAACGHTEVRTAAAGAPTVYVAPVEAQAATRAALRPGFGKVVYLVDPTGPIDGISWQYMTVRMQDGSLQDVAKRGRQIPWGAKVTITAENTVRWDPLALNQ
jgi:hypothetical protein